MVTLYGTVNVHEKFHSNRSKSGISHFLCTVQKMGYANQVNAHAKNSISWIYLIKNEGVASKQGRGH